MTKENRKEVKILGTGVATMDMYPKQKRMYPGGNEYNVVCNAALRGAKAGFLGVFANDTAGQILEDTLKNVGVDSSRSHHEIGSSGYSLVELKEDGDRVFLMWNQKGVTDLHPIAFTDDEIDYIKEFDVLCMGRLSCVSQDTIRHLHQIHGLSICYDFHAVFDEETIEAIAPYISYAFFSCWNLEEDLIRKCLKRTVELGCKLAIGTRGSDPIIAYDGKRFYTQETQHIEATDTLGAGDSYIAAFLTEYLKREKEEKEPKEKVIQEALATASEHAAKVICMDGSMGVGYDFDPKRMGDLVNLEEED